MEDEILKILTRFHRDVLLPDVKQAIEDSESRALATSLSHLDSIYARFDRLEIEYHSLAAGVARLEAALGVGATSIPRVSIQKQISDLRERVDALQHRLDQLDSSAS